MIKNKTIHKIRLDNLLVERGLAETREKAKSLIMAGHIISNGQKLTKAGTSVPNDIPIELMSQDPFVSRGGIKLEHVIEYLGLDLSGMRILDVGASTGGFTDCMLQKGAKQIFALDVGYGQIANKLREDSRVVVLDRVNAHYPFKLPAKVNIVTIDVSFISITKIIPNVLAHLERPSIMIVLVKPQFEAMQSDVGKKGIIKDPKIHAKVLGDIIRWAALSKLTIQNLIPSPITGAKGNREFFLVLEH
jgi:23S rRNA (cytidine1920-2'-O)/16S rRNA (cytidine1409-2'-O)-methyltransferase